MVGREFTWRRYGQVDMVCVSVGLRFCCYLRYCSESLYQEVVLLLQKWLAVEVHDTAAHEHFEIPRLPRNGLRTLTQLQCGETGGETDVDVPCSTYCLRINNPFY